MTVTRGQSPNDRYESRRHSHACCPLEFRRTVASIKEKRLESKRKRKERFWGAIQIVVIVVLCLGAYKHFA